MGYKFKTKPRAHQAASLKASLNAPVWAHFHEQRCGKTKIVLDTAGYHASTPPTDPLHIDALLIIAMPSGVPTQWVNDEMPTHLPTTVPYKALIWNASKTATKTFQKAQEELLTYKSLAVLAVNGEAIITKAFRTYAPKFLKTHRTLVACDECFVAGTLINTATGALPIETLQPGVLILTSSGYKPLKRAFKGAASVLVKVTLANGQEITCTQNHPFFTNEGWVCAKDLFGKTTWTVDALRRMQDTFSTTTPNERSQILRSILLSEMADASTSIQAHAAQSKAVGDSGRQTQGQTHVARQATPTRYAGQSFLEQRCSNERQEPQAVEQNITGHGPSDTAPSPWWERAWVNATASGIIENTRFELAPGICHRVGRKASWLSNLLQGRFSVPEEKYSCGYRRGWAQQPIIQNARSKEGQETSGTWVVSVETFQSNRPRVVYNLEIESCPHYFSNGVLVHNSTLVCKTNGTERSKIMRALGKHPNVVMKRIMDGTPYGESPMDFFAQFNWMDPQILGHDSFYTYRQHYAVLEKQMATRINPRTKKPERYQYETVAGYRNLDELNQRIARYSDRVRRADISDAPAKTYIKLRFDLTPEQRRVYDEIEQEHQSKLHSGETVTVAYVLTRMMRLQQVTSNILPTNATLNKCQACDGSGEQHGDICEPCDGLGVIPTAGPVRRIDTKENPRLTALHDEITLTKQPSIIWCRFTSDVDDVMQMLKQAGRKPIQYDGRISQTGKEVAKQAFQSKDATDLVGNPKAGGRGLRLDRAEAIYYYSNLYSLLVREQSEDRAEDVDRKISTTVADLMANNTEDENIVQNLRDKRTLSEIVMKEKRGTWI